MPSQVDTSKSVLDCQACGAPTEMVPLHTTNIDGVRCPQGNGCHDTNRLILTFRCVLGHVTIFHRAKLRCPCGWETLG